MIDLHMHTIFSDGKDSIEKIIDKWIENKLEIVSITDHDTIDGVLDLISKPNLLQKLHDNNIKFVKGIEFSSVIDGNKVHLLGYDYNVENKEFNDAINIGLIKRNKKFETRLKAIKEQFGIEYSEKSINEMRNSKEFLGSPLMAMYLVKEGYYKDWNEAMAKCLRKLEYSADDTRVDAKIVVPAIVVAGGICSWAHPLGGIGEPKITFDKVEEIIEKLKPLGLKVLECYYSLYSQDEINKLISIANKHGLLISGGSDYHGREDRAKLCELSSKGKIDLSKDDLSIISLFDNII